MTELLLKVYAKQDGTWLEFCPPTGKRAALRIENLAGERGHIIGKAIRDWCDHHQQEQRGSVCPTCGGTGAIDAPFSGSDPGCENCDGEGRKLEE